MLNATHYILRVFFIASSIILLACNSTTQPHSDTDKGNNLSLVEFGKDDAAQLEMHQLLSSFRRSEKLTIIYGDKSYEPLLSQLTNSNYRTKVELLHAQEANYLELDSIPLLLIGTHADNPVIAKWQNNTPFKKTNQGFEFDGESYNEAQNFFLLGAYPKPNNPAIPFSIISGNSSVLLLQNLKKIFNNDFRRILWNAWNYQIYKGNKRLILGQFGGKDGVPWQITKQTHWDFANHETLLKQSEHFSIIQHGKPHQSFLDDLLPNAEESRILIEKFCNKQYGGKNIEIHAYESSEIKGLLINDTQHENADFSNQQVHKVTNAEYAQNHIGEVNKLLIRELLNKPKINALETGLALHFTKQWQKEGYHYWATKLYKAQSLIPLSELLDNDWFQKESRLVFDCMSGVLVDFLIAEWGKEKFLEKYSSWKPSNSEIEQLDTKWDDYFNTIILPNHPHQYTLSPFIPNYFKGFNFAHEGYSIYNGYNSKLAERSLNELQKLGTNAIAIVPYSYMSNPKKPNFLNFTRFAGGETDESVVHASYEAKAREMHTLLKPQIWLGGGSWPGDVSMESESDWELFFDYYFRWMRHYALLAEIHEIDMLCLGVEFAKATIAKPENWIQMANNIRKIYSGKLTYAANWGSEAEKNTIWPAFDYIGINCYYPLSKDDKPSHEEMSKKFASTLKMLREKTKQFNKPVLFTEIGFRSVSEVWKVPHNRPENSTFNEDDQQTCYQIVFENLPDNPWIHGMFWWKWPSYLSYADKNKEGFSPAKRKATAVVKKWFAALNKKK